MATLPAYLNALPGKGVHVVTVNEYLAQRDADWMGRSTASSASPSGVIKNAQMTTPRSARPTPATSPTAPTTNSASTTCATTSRSGSRTACSAALNFAIVDEVDSILIDEARTPLIISGPAEESTELYLRINELVPRLTRQKEEDGPGDYCGRREAQAGAPHRGRATSTSSSCMARGRAAARGREPLRPGQHPPDAPPERGAARARAVQARRRVHRARRRGHHRRRVHRPHDARPALVGRPAPGGRGQGRRARSARRTRRSPRSPSRTTSACTRSSPA